MTLSWEANTLLRRSQALHIRLGVLRICFVCTRIKSAFDALQLMSAFDALQLRSSKASTSQAYRTRGCVGCCEVAGVVGNHWQAHLQRSSAGTTRDLSPRPCSHARTGSAQQLILSVALQPKEDKYRKIKLTNEKINTMVVQVENAVDALRALGWVQEDQDLEYLVIPAGKYMTMREVSHFGSTGTACLHLSCVAGMADNRAFNVSSKGPAGRSMHAD